MNIPTLKRGVFWSKRLYIDKIGGESEKKIQKIIAIKEWKESEREWESVWERERVKGELVLSI